MSSLRPCYYVGLDLGLPQEFTALAVVEKTYVEEVRPLRRQVSHYAVRCLQRFRIGTPYDEIADAAVKLFADPLLASSPLVVDQSAVGKPVVSLIRQKRHWSKLVPVTVTAGHQASHDGGGWLVPKKELVSTLQVLLQGRRLRVSDTLAEAPMLVKELTEFRPNLQLKATDELLDWRDRPHDDLVLAVAIAIWFGERCPPPATYKAFGVARPGLPFPRRAPRTGLVGW